VPDTSFIPIAELREDVADVLVGGLLIALALVSLGLSVLRSREQDRLLKLFGAFCGLYGLRMLLDTEVLVPLLGIPRGLADYVTAVITYLIQIPGLLFAFWVFGPGWRFSIRIMLWVQSVYTAGAILIDSVLGPETAMGPNNFLVIVNLVVIVGNSLLYSRRNAPVVRTVLAGALFFAVMALNENLVDAGLVPWRWSYEALGMLVFVLCLGYVVVRRLLADERRLVALTSELDTARQIQTSILPQAMPEVAGLEVAARCIPMTAVGGDFFDFLILDGRRLGILVADVSGHGVPAALIASMVKIALASQADQAADPAAVLVGMNRILRGKMKRSFVTAAYVFLDAEGRTLRYASAGHPPLLLRRTGEGGVEEIRQEAPPLGVLPRAAYRNTELELAPGDRVFLYTDGVTEARNGAEEDFGDERLRELAATAGDLAPAAFADELLRRLEAWRGKGRDEGFDDDVTAVVVALAG
jgi:sigma-B regulation protein RsbU (phosphoserine phosphatase)